MLVVVALGGNALLRRGEPMDADLQRANVKLAAEAVAELAREHQVVLTHGNGPQVGLLALQNAAFAGVAPYPLDILDAETEGMVGYLLQQALGRHLDRRRIATLLTQVVVDPDDPAFLHPTKFVGPTYDDPGDVRRLEAERGWTFDRDGGAWRRVVPSPEPASIIEIDVVRLLVVAGVTVICSGGGGIPVVDGDDGLVGVEAVIDKDLSAAVLAGALGADALLLLTDIDAVYTGWGSESAQALHDAEPSELRALGLPAGSMGPKVEAICRFVEDGGAIAGIGALEDAAAILQGRAGTVVRGARRREQP
jgi:carbamate kinase